MTTDDQAAHPPVEVDVQKVCDKLIERTVELMALVADPEMILDRLLTYGVAQVVARQGKAGAIDVLAGIAHHIEEGGFDAVVPPVPN